jgi:hypothetical protein
MDRDRPADRQSNADANITIHKTTTLQRDQQIRNLVPMIIPLSAKPQQKSKRKKDYGTKVDAHDPSRRILATPATLCP